MSPTAYLISGANRGIGLGFVISLASRENVIVFAGTRNPASATDLQALVKKYPGKIHVVKLTSADKADNDAAIAEIKRISGRLDVVIANAGISQFYGPTLNTPVEQMNDHYNINVVGPLVLFQATYPLLTASTKSPKFIPISSIAGSISFGTSLKTIIMVPYGSSKAALNYMTRRWHFEFPDLITFPLNPGPVETDMSVFGRDAANFEGVDFISVEECVKGLLREIDNGTRESSGGQFVDHSGSKLEW